MSWPDRFNERWYRLPTWVRVALWVFVGVFLCGVISCEAQAAPRDVTTSVTMAGDSAIVTVSWLPANGNFDGYVASLAMTGTSAVSVPHPKTDSYHRFIVQRGPTNGQTCVAATRGGRVGSQTCATVTIIWPEEPIPTVVIDTVTVEVGIAPAPPPAPVDTTTPPPPPGNVGTTPQPEALGYAELPRVWLNPAPPPVVRTVNVTACSQLQPALTGAASGDRIQLAAGLRCLGNFVVRAGARDVTLTTAGASLPAGERARPSTAGGFATLVAAGVEPALRLTGPVSGWYVSRIAVEADPAKKLNWALVRVGTGSETTVDSQPRGVTFSQVVVAGHDSLQLQRCMALEGMNLTVEHSWITGCHYKGSDAQAIVSWNSRGPFRIVNNRLEGSGENVMWGGADPKIPGMVAGDIEFRRNHVIKPAWWKTTDVGTEKNLFELKNAERVLVEDNVFDGNWSEGQVGIAIVIKSSNQSGGCGWCVSKDLTFRDNWVKNTPGFFSLHGIDNYTAGAPAPARAHNLTVVRNLLTGNQTYAGSRQVFQVTGGRKLAIAYNTMPDLGMNTIVNFDGLPADSSLFVGNLMAKTNYGIKGNGLAEGTATITPSFPGLDYRDNVLVGATASRYPAGNGNSYPSAMPASTPAGVDVPALMARLEGVVVAP